MANTIDAKLDFDFVEDLSRFEQNIKDKVLFTGVAAMAKSQYDEVRLRCPVSEHAHFFYGRSSKKNGVRYYFEPGNLLASIYRAYSPEKSSADVKTYRVSWNHRKAPYGFMVEFGTSNAPAHPFLRPAFDRINEAISIGKAAMAQRLATVGGDN